MVCKVVLGRETLLTLSTRTSIRACSVVASFVFLEVGALVERTTTYRALVLAILKGQEEVIIM